MSLHNQGRTLVSPYVGMVWEQDGGCTSNYNYDDNSAQTKCDGLWTAFLSFSSFALANETGNITWQQRQGSKVASKHWNVCLFFSSFFSQTSALTPKAINIPTKKGRNFSGVLHLLLYF